MAERPRPRPPAVRRAGPRPRAVTDGPRTDVPRADRPRTARPHTDRRGDGMTSDPRELDVAAAGWRRRSSTRTARRDWRAGGGAAAGQGAGRRLQPDRRPGRGGPRGAAEGDARLRGHGRLDRAAAARGYGNRAHGGRRRVFNFGLTLVDDVRGLRREPGDVRPARDHQHHRAPRHGPAQGRGAVLGARCVSRTTCGSGPAR